MALIFDITKAYNSIRTGIVEKNLRRFWFRKNPQEDWKTFRFECVQFGDRPAAAIMTIAVERAAESFEEVANDLNIDVEEVKEDSIKLLKDTYVDDGMTGGTKKQVDRMIGSRMEDGSFSGTIPRMMKKVGLKLKTIVTSKSSDQESISMLSDTYIILWETGLASASSSILPRRRKEPKFALISNSMMLTASSRLLYQGGHYSPYAMLCTTHWDW